MLSVEVRKTLSKYLFCGELLKNKGSVLDAFCGKGMGSYVLAPFFEEVCGVDISKENIDWAKKHLKNEDLSYSYFPGKEIYKLGTFEAIILLDTEKKFDSTDTYISYLNYLCDKNLINNGKLIFDYNESNKQQLKNYFLTRNLEEYEEFSLFSIVKDFYNRLQKVTI